MIKTSNIAGQHKDSVALLFLKYGISAPITTESLQYAIAQHGEKFAEELSNAVANNFDVFIGQDGRQQLVMNNFPGKIIKKVGQVLRKKKNPTPEDFKQQLAIKAPDTIRSLTPLTPIQVKLSNPDIKDVAKSNLSAEVRDDVKKLLAPPVEQPKTVIKEEVKKGLLGGSKAGGVLGKITDAIDDIADMVRGEDDSQAIAANNQAKSIWPSIIGFGVVVIVVIILYFIGKNKN